MWIGRQDVVFFGTFLDSKIEENWTQEPFRFVIIILRGEKTAPDGILMIFWRLMSYKSTVFDREVLHKSEFGTIEYSIPEK